MLNIRPCEDTDWPQLWAILQPTFAAGDTYAHPPDSSEAEVRQIWTVQPRATFVACDAHGRILGTYYIKSNQPGLGGHVCNCGYVVSPAAQGRGLASAMCLHSQELARAMGFLAMQFNLVVSTNERAVRLWTRLGFDTVGRLPKAFRHARLGLVDALVMFKTLV
jgi:ribosomal protein S18 acetylase RimI-like enzyme